MAVVDEQGDHDEGDHYSQSQMPEHVASVAVQKRLRQVTDVTSGGRGFWLTEFEFQSADRRRKGETWLEKQQKQSSSQSHVKIFLKPQRPSMMLRPIGRPRLVKSNSEI